MKTTFYFLFFFLSGLCFPFSLSASLDSLQIDQRIKETRRLANTHQYQAAIEANLELIPLLEDFYQTKEHKAIASTYSRLGNCQDDLGLYSDAVASHLIALEMRRKLFGESSYAVGTSYNNLGVAYWSQGLYEDALEMQLIALENRIRNRGKNHIKTARSYENVAICYELLRDFGLSIRYYEKALIILEQNLSPDDLEISDLYVNIAACQRRMGQYDKALSSWKQAEKIHLKQKKLDPKRYARLRNNMGYCYYNLGCYYDAIQNLEESLEIKKEIYPAYHLEVGQSVENLSYVYRELKEWKKAKAFAQRALIIHSQEDNYNVIEVVSAYENLAVIALDMGELEQAKEYLEEAKNVINLMDKYSGKNVLSSNAFEIDLNSDFADVFLQEYSRSQEISDLKKSLAYTLKSVAIINQFRLSNQTDQAKIYLNARVLPIYERGIEAAYLLYQQSAQSDYLETILQLMEKSKSIILHESLENTRASLSNSLPASIVQIEYDLQHEIAQLEKEHYELKSEHNIDTTALYKVHQKLFDTRGKLDIFLADLEKNHPKYFQLKYDTTATTFAAIQHYLTDNQTLVEYFLGKEYTYALVTNKSAVEIKRWKNGQSLEALIVDFQRNVYQYNPFVNSDDNYAQTAYSLYHRLLEPIVHLLTERVTIIPDRVIGYVPFSALISELPVDIVAFQDYAYLLRKHQFSYVHSATLFNDLLARNNANNKKSLLAIAPFFTDESPIALRSGNRNNLNNLKYNVEESQLIAQHWEGDLVVENQATKAFFLEAAGDYNFLHLATHGQANDDDGDFANLAFTGDSPDNLLYLREIYNLKLNTEMVVLSACETGTGPLRKGDGIISLARGFTYAGAKSVITTLWKINDRTSVNLMDQFYRSLLDRNTKDTALQQAQLNYINTQPAHLAHPFYWASFIPIGNMKVIQPRISIAYILKLLSIGGACLILLMFFYNRLVGGALDVML